MSIADLSAAPTRVGPDLNGLLFTPSEYDAIEDWDENYRYELVNGVLIVVPPPDFGERSPNSFLAYLLWRHHELQGETGRLAGTAEEQEIQCGDNRRRCDRAIWVGREGDFDPDSDVPTIAVEFVSKTSRDRRRDYVDKRAEYLAAGVTEYWVIDRFEREMTVFRGEEVFTVAEQATYATPLLPGFELPLAKLLAKADRGREERP